MPDNDHRREDSRLRNWDAQTAWLPWQPTGDDPWDLSKAAHLLRRAAFGFPAYREGEDAWQGLNRVAAQGFDATLAELLGPPNLDIDDAVDAASQRAAADDDIDSLRGCWLYRMLFAPQPLVERMTLFWHNHFATSVRKVRRLDWMFAQNRLFRRHALDKFEPLLQAVGRDPAMIVWLDSYRNVKGRPNENYGRELMELFTLGVGNYTERDVQETARAFTGWHLGAERFARNARLHDDGTKTVLGQTGAFDGDDVPRILLEQPATAMFLVRKLFRQFVSESEAPTDALLEPLATALRQSGYDMRLVVERMISSRLFFSPAAWRQRIKGPVEYLVGAVRGLGGKYPIDKLVPALEGLGQDLFAPPNVKGWDGGQAWLNTATLLARHNMLWKLLQPPPEPTSPNADEVDVADSPPTPSDEIETYPNAEPLGEFFHTDALPKKFAGDDPTRQVALLADLFLQGDIAESTRTRLVDYLQAGSPRDDAWDARIRETLHALLVLPEYHLA